MSEAEKQTDTAPELLPCPFCNGPAEVTSTVGGDEGDGYNWHVFCAEDNDCVVMPDLYRESQRVAIDHWNYQRDTRTRSPVEPAGDPTRFLDRSFVWMENKEHSVRLIQRDQDDNDPRKGISIKWEDLPALRELITLALEDGPMVIGPQPLPECPTCCYTTADLAAIAAKSASTPATGADDYIGYCRYVNHGQDNDGGDIITFDACDSDSKGAFRVYAAPPPATENQEDEQ